MSKIFYNLLIDVPSPIKIVSINQNLMPNKELNIILPNLEVTKDDEIDFFEIYVGAACKISIKVFYYLLYDNIMGNDYGTPIEDDDSYFEELQRQEDEEYILRMFDEFKL